MRRWGGVLAVLALGTLALTGCGDDDDDTASPSGSASEAPADDGEGEGETLSVTATDYKFEGVGETLQGGVVTVEFTNEGEQPHELGLAKLADELDAEGFGELLGPVFEGAPFPDDFQGHTGITETAPGETTTSTFTLEEGNYALYCAISDESESESEEGAAGEEAEEAPPHFLMGMYQTLKVEGDNGGELPDDAVITATDYTFEIPDLEAGEQELTFINGSDEQWHHIVLLGWEDGTDEAEAAAAFKAEMEAEEGAPPPEGLPETVDELGSQVFSPGGGGTFPVKLTSGRTYTAACFIHDITGGPPHAVAHDMVVHFTVE